MEMILIRSLLIDAVVLCVAWAARSSGKSIYGLGLAAMVVSQFVAANIAAAGYGWSIPVVMGVFFAILLDPVILVPCALILYLVNSRAKKT